MLIYILIALAVLTVLFMLIVVTRPPSFRTARSAMMSAPPDVVFAQVNDLHQWPAWSPWEKLDPNLKRTYAGAPAGAGAVYSWSGQKQVGEGRMTITESRPSELIRFNLEFFKPFKATNTALFTFTPQAGQTNVTWSMEGRKNFMFKAMGLFCNLDKMVGRDFEKGLANLKVVVESSAAR
jgi:hypothetical protein